MPVKLAHDASKEEANDSVVKKFTAALTCAVCTYTENRELSKILLVKSMGTSELFEKKRWHLLDKTRQYLMGVLEHLSEKHSIRIHEIEVSSVSLTHSIFGVITYWLEDRIPFGLTDMIFALCAYHLRALSIAFTDNEVRQYIHQTVQAKYENLMQQEEKVNEETN